MNATSSLPKQPAATAMDTAPWTRKDLVGLQDLTAAEITHVLDTAAAFKDVGTREIKKVPALRGQTMVNLFVEASTRTRVSFELAAHRLSADVINMTASTSSLTKGETLKDTAKNLEALHADIIVLRHSSAGAAQFLAEVARSNIHALLKLGARVTLVGPRTLVPREFEPLGVKVTHDLDSVVPEADVVNLLRIQHERQRKEYFPSLGEYTSLFGLTKERAERLKPGALIMHPGPINRGVEIDSDLADSSRSVILDQVTNGLAVRMAVLYLCAGTNPKRG
jgi:aspartate carbamoyltransferase catalytic subunit